jgi:adenylylsulfate kinase
MINRTDKEYFLNQKSVTIWFTGLSGSGKTTLAKEIEEALFREGFLAQLLDGDQIRKGVNSNLGYSEEDREENIRRIAEITKLFINCGIICIDSFISPTHKIRQMARDIIGPENFIEVFLNASVEVCEKRDPKGLYKAAREGKIPDFTGISATYEIPLHPDIEIDTGELSVEESVERCMTTVFARVRMQENYY